MHKSTQVAKDKSLAKLKIISKHSLQKAKKNALFKITVFASIFLVITLAVRAIVYPQFSDQSIILYLQLAEVGVIGYFAIRIAT